MKKKGRLQRLQAALFLLLTINYWTNFPGQLISASIEMEAEAFLSAIGATVSAAKHQFSTTMRIAAADAQTIEATVKTL